MSKAPSLQLDSATLADEYDRLGIRQFNHGLQLLDALSLREGERVLDIGCGTGRLTESAAQRVGVQGDVLGIDPLPLRVERALQRAQGQFAARVGRAEQLADIADAHFDVVYLNSVIHWIPDQPQALREAWRVLKPGGRLGFTTMPADVPHDLHRVLHTLIVDDPQSPRAEIGAPNKLTRDSAASLLSSVGFELTLNEIRTFDDAFDNVDDVLTFSRASSFGNFLSSLDEPHIARLRERLATALEAHRGPRGLQLTRRMIFVTGRKPLAH
ncbi:methyltransferase domain-containing protein [Paraburkholderia sp. Tr-20389]|uniref:class I SAM-dependent methyltransferase n=1 Tax=Paraburkholderia sp. Tr-20389 TaxID=2703903 RepID=UPI00197F30EC|nr:methyltransferase domain-containing protein [Paraburkholderia sp. Tr-20389]MBN3752387.1 methyltransferase domain-containing protein [Paraburkholderia sp. Tr-20389]